MLSISPISAQPAAAVPTTATSIYALHGWRDDEKPAPASNAKLNRSAGGGITTLTAADIPDDEPPVGPQPHVWVKRFEHTPTITYRRGDQVEVIRGPITPTIPHATEATRAGWDKFFCDVPNHTEAAKKAAEKKVADLNAYWKKRQDDKDVAWEAKCERALKKGKPLPERSKRQPPPDWTFYVKDPEFIANFQAARYNRSVAKRMRKFEHKTVLPIGGRVYKTFNEIFEHSDGSRAPAIRSWLGPIALNLFNSALPTHVCYGYDKEVEYSRDTPRLFALDNSHIVLDKHRRCAFIVDLDGWWVSIEALRSHLRKLLPAEFMPNIITYRGAEDGKGGVENPHLVWMLPPGARVTWKGRGKKTQQFKLHEMVQSGIVSLLIPVGADPGHTNAFKTKNPLCPGYSVDICDDYFHTMAEWRSFLPTITPNKREMQRRAKIHKASQQSGEEVSASQAIWNDAKNFRRLEIAAAQHSQNPTFLKARKKAKTFVDWLYNDVDGVVTLRLIAEHGDTKAVRSVLRAQRQFVVDLDMTPGAIGEWCDRGRDADLNAEEFKPLPRTATQEERVARAKLIKHRARQRTQANKEAIHCGLIAEEIESRMAAGIQVIRSEVVNALIKAGKVKRSTAYNHFNRCLEIVQLTARYQDPSFDNQSIQSGQQIEATRIHDAVSDSEATVSEPAAAPMTVAQVRNPAKTSDQTYPKWVVYKDTLTLWEGACWIRDEWSTAVAKWRKSQQQRPSSDVDLVELDKFQTMVLDRSSWSHGGH